MSNYLVNFRFSLSSAPVRLFSVFMLEPVDPLGRCGCDDGHENANDANDDDNDRIVDTFCICAQL